MKQLTTRLVTLKGGSARAVQNPVLSLKVTAGPCARQTATVTLPRVLLGSAPAAAFQLADRTVSALHCELWSDLEGLRVRDLGSKNGVYLRERRVTEAWLEDGDAITLGHSVIKVQATDDFEERPLSEAEAFFGLLGSSLPMRQLYQLLDRAAKADAPVLLLGETGTGKELAAEALVSAGPRADRPLVVVDCGALAHGLAEAELFGREEGAYTDARAAQPGAFERADGGTLFLDEVGELPLELQPKLLGVLERKQVQRLGSGEARALDVRVIAATHRPLEAMVNAGTFRADLYHRLSALTLQLPPLRARREDIPRLVLHFLGELPGGPALAPGVLEALKQGEYPGNVRELRNAVMRAALNLPEPVRPDAAPAGGPHAWNLDQTFRPQKERLFAELERGYLLQLLEACEGNVSEAARRSGLNRVHLYQLFERHRLGRRLGARRGQK
ncbi:MAG: sigma 54-dependent Fis family transcriptional regulator [Archangiaceae bacterium]|nr:sigma 54-dependent Fis family transcriptional regulator [Archangiaceae bacterium]